MTDQARIDRIVKIMETRAGHPVWTAGDMGQELGTTEAEALEALLEAVAAGALPEPSTWWYEGAEDEAVRLFQLPSVRGGLAP